jgi:beta-barrel assembly-enhancing protease
MKLLRAALLLALPALVCACATPTLQSPTTDPVSAAREAAMQRKFIIERRKAQWGRVSRVMFRVNVGAAEFCKDHTTGAFGLAGMTAKQFGSQYEAIARGEFGFDDGLMVTAVFPGSPAEAAGLLPGDRLISFGSNATSMANQETYLRTSAMNDRPIPIQYRRNGSTYTAMAVPKLACNFPAVVEEDSQVNAFANGQMIVFNTGMLNFVSSDEELAVVASHELSHNILDHSGKKKENAVTGTMIGLAADILIIATTGVNPGLYRAGAQIGARAYSVEFEQEADYQGLYLMRRAGYQIGNAANFWRRMAAENPSSISIRSTHPTSPERALALNTAVTEIETKESQKLALIPNAKGAGGNALTAIASSSSGGSPTAFVPASSGSARTVSSTPDSPAQTAFSAAPIAKSPYLLGIRSSGEVTANSISAIYMGKDPHGVAIGTLDPDGAAAKAGVRVGDVITTFNGSRIDTLADLRNQISKATSPEAKLELNRSGKTLAINLRL